MTTLKEEAQGYEPKRTLNIADLDKVSVEVTIYDEKDVEFPYKFIELNDQRYRVPITVIKSLNAIMKFNEKLKYFKVNKSGDGMNTSYTVIPLE